MSNWVCNQKSVHENYFAVHVIIINCNKPYKEKENSNIQMFWSKTMLDWNQRYSTSWISQLNAVLTLKLQFSQLKKK